jgi:hypothetical protein
MKFQRLILIFAFVLLARPAAAQTTEIAPAEGGTYSDSEEDQGGWFLGSDQGVMFFVGDSANLVNLQYFGSVFGGYNIKGYFMPMIRLGQAIGSLDSFFQPTTFFFIFEGGFRATPLRTKIRPFFSATAGLYVLDVDDFGSPVRNGANFTFSAGGGIEYNFGHNTIGLGTEYRGFVNSGPFLNAIAITLGYTFTF